MKCFIIEDLLPEYMEDICSPETKKEIEEHVSGCANCRRKLEIMRKDQEALEGKCALGSEDIKPFQKIEKELKRNRIKKRVAILLLVIVCMGFGILTVGQFFPTLPLPSYDSLMYRFEAKQIARELVDGNIEKVLKGASNSLDFTNRGDSQEVFFRDMVECLTDIHGKIFEGKETKIRVDSVIYEDRYGMETDHKEYCYKVKLILTVEDQEINMTVSFGDKYSYSFGLDMGENMYLEANQKGEDSLEYKIRDMMNYLNYYHETRLGYSSIRTVTNGRVSARNYESINNSDKDSGFLSYYFVEDCNREGEINADTGENDYCLKVGRGFYEILKRCKSNDFQMTHKDYNPEKKKYNVTLYWRITDLKGKTCMMSKEFYYGSTGYEAVDDTETILSEKGFDGKIVENLKEMFD